MDIDLKDFHYSLPESNIAAFPLDKRDHSKLLVYKNRQVLHHRFTDILDHIPEESILFFNDTKVIPARLVFQKTSGALIEIFILQPTAPTDRVHLAMQVKNRCVWQCMVGNLRKWKEEETLKKSVEISGNNVEVSIRLVDRDQKLVAFEWEEAVTFAEIVEAGGATPLPPYIKRKATMADKSRYQTLYSKAAGAVAAPTAGLHFTEEILQNLDQKGIRKDFLTLHVSAGTFQPIKKDDVRRHQMHAEQVIITEQTVRNLDQTSRRVIAVGTTSVRTLESLYWYGVKLLRNESSSFEIAKLYPYQFQKEALPSRTEAMQAVLEHMQRENIGHLIGKTEIFIMPGYEFKMCDGLITNFHMPGSTLILLVAAFVGSDWRKIYQEALNNQYRFLSYGDSSLLLPGTTTEWF